MIEQPVILSKDQKTVTITPTCTMCKEPQEAIVVTVEGYARWHRGELIQHALPELSVDQREMLISGTCPKCWDKLFNIPEDAEF